MHDPVRIAVAVLAALFIGISKAGFGGGLGMLTTPLCVLAFGPKDAIGILLPLLCVGDLFSLYHYWGKWERRNLLFLLPGVVIGVIVGVQLIGRFSARELNLAIGVLAVFFVSFQLVKEAVFRAEGAFAPNHALGIPCGSPAPASSWVAILPCAGECYLSSRTQRLSIFTTRNFPGEAPKGEDSVTTPRSSPPLNVNM